MPLSMGAFGNRCSQPRCFVLHSQQLPHIFTIVTLRDSFGFSLISHSEYISAFELQLRRMTGSPCSSEAGTGHIMPFNIDPPDDQNPVQSWRRLSA